MAYMQLFGRAFRVSFASRAAYRGDFLLSTVMTLLFEAITPMVTVLIYRAGASFPGWSIGEALLIQAIFLIARGIALPCFSGIIWSVFEQVREGTFELTLLKPRSPLLITIITSFNIEGFARLFGGIGLLALALGQIPKPGAIHFSLFLGLMFLSVLVLFGFVLIMAGSLFVWVGNSRVIEVMESVYMFAQYPGSIFGRTFQLAISVVIPISMIAFLPAQALLGRPEPITIAAIPASIAFFCASLGLWRAMLRRYSSGGG